MKTTQALQPKLIIFDFDGTLADTFPSFVHVFDEAADKYGFKRLDRSQQKALRDLDARQMMAHHEIPMWKVPMIAAFMRKRLGADIDRVSLFDGIAGVLRTLSAQGIILTIVTSNSRSNVLRILGPELSGLFRHLECGSSLFGKLPKVRKVLAANGVSRDHALMIGDEIRDAKVAAEAGVAFGAVAWGFNNIEALIAQNPRQVFRQVSDLLLGDTAPLRPE